MRMAFAPQVGLEPTTYGLTVRRSNQLSYWGKYLSISFCFFILILADNLTFR